MIHGIVAGSYLKYKIGWTMVLSLLLGVALAIIDISDICICVGFNHQESYSQACVIFTEFSKRNPIIYECFVFDKNSI